MRRFVFITITILVTIQAFSQTRSADREPYAAGRFYSSDKVFIKVGAEDLATRCQNANGQQQVIYRSFLFQVSRGYVEDDPSSGHPEVIRLER
jgi:hypothetical protein